MNLTFKRATRQQIALKLGISGPSGSGKTTAALRLARGLVGPQGLIAFGDTENGSASAYSDLTEFDVINMNPPYAIAKFRQLLEAAEQGGYHALILDSTSHAWTELLAKKEAMDARGGNSFTNWGIIGKEWDGFLAAIRDAKIHVICCLRSKQDHVQDKDANGKTTIRKVGFAPVAREGFEYELFTVFELGMDHSAKTSKDRTGLFDGRLWPIQEATGRELAEWLASGKTPAPEPPRLPMEEENTQHQEVGHADSGGKAPAPLPHVPLTKDGAPTKQAVREAFTQAQVEATERNQAVPISQEASDFVDGLEPIKWATAEEVGEILDLARNGKVPMDDLAIHCFKKG